MRDTLRDTNARLEQQVRERTAALLAAQDAEEKLQAAHEDLETRVVERTTALADASREIGARALQQAAVASLGQRALASGELTALMDDAARLVADTLGIELTSVLEYSREENELRLRAGQGWPREMIGNYVALANEQTPAGYALIHTSPVITEDLAHETRFTPSPHMRASGVRSNVLLTIGGHDPTLRCIGRVQHPATLVQRGRRAFPTGGRQRARRSIDRKRAEEVIRRSQAIAENANAAKSEFLSRMSHELRTPLNAILGFGQLLEQDGLGGQQAQGVKHILKAGRHLLNLIDEVLDIARIEAGRLDVDIQPVSISKLLDDVIPLVRPLADRRRIRLDYMSCPSSESWSMCSPTKKCFGR